VNFKHWLSQINENRPELAVLTPSWLSGLIAVTIALVVVAMTVIGLHYRSSDFQLLRAAQVENQAISYNYQAVNNSFSSNTLLSDLPLLVLWGGVGLVVYSLTMRIVGSYSRAMEFRQELDYVHADRQALIRSAITRALIRLLVLIAWFLYLQFTVHVLLPYVIALAYAGSGSLDLNLWQETFYLIAGVVLLALTIHLHTVALRLALLKTRVLE
jgi:hypothetical protein